jgi:L-arabinose isomerase
MPDPVVAVETDLKLIAAVVAAGAAIVAAVVGPLISAWIAKRQNDVALQIAVLHTVTPIKEKWINDVRASVSEFCHLSSVAVLNFSEDDSDLNERNLDRSFLAARSAVFLFDRRDPKQQEIVSAIAHANEAVSGFGNNDGTTENIGILLKAASDSVLRLEKLTSEYIHDELYTNHDV